MSEITIPFSPAGERAFAVIPAAGVGSRLGAAVPKQYLRIAGQSLLAWSLMPLLGAAWIARVLVVVSPKDVAVVEALGELVASAGDRLVIADIGGATRRDSVLAGLDALAVEADAPAPDDWVLVHDAARPGLGAHALERLRTGLFADPVGGLLALPMADTVKRADATGRTAGTVPREALWLAQTPQMFRFDLLRSALRGHATATDEASAVEAAGFAAKLIEGERRNFKVTTADDFELMNLILPARSAGSGR